MRDDIIAALDIGSTDIRLAVAQQNRGGDGKGIQVIGAVSVPAEGISKGSVKSIEDVTSSISECLEKAERLVGLPITNVWVGVNSPYVKCEKSRGVVAISRSDGEVTNDDVERALEAARALSVPPNYEIIHVLPIKFTVDKQQDIKDPVGMTGIRLEVETLIIQGLSTQIKNLTKAIFRTGIEIEDLVLSPLSAAEAVIGPKQKELGSALVNIGASTTSLAVFEEGGLLYAAVLPIGSEHITADVAIGLRCPINLAERIKKEYGGSNSAKFDDDQEVNIEEISKDEGINDEVKTINRKYLAEIIEARVEEIFEKIDEELKKIDRSGMLPGGVFLIGGGARLKDITDTAKQKLRLPVSLGVNKGVQTVIDKVNDLEFLNSLGLLAWGAQVQDTGDKKGFKMPNTEIIGKSVEKMKKWISSLMP